MSENIVFGGSFECPIDLDSTETVINKIYTNFEDERELFNEHSILVSPKWIKKMNQYH